MKILLVACALAFACVSVIGAKADPLNPTNSPYFSWTKIRCDVMDQGTPQETRFCHRLVVEQQSQCFYTATVVKDATGTWQQVSLAPWAPGMGPQFCFTTPNCPPGMACVRGR
jgi:hypothetical protein